MPGYIQFQNPKKGHDKGNHFDISFEIVSFSSGIFFYLFVVVCFLLFFFFFKSNQSKCERRTLLFIQECHIFYGTHKNMSGI